MQPGVCMKEFGIDRKRNHMDNNNATFVKDGGAFVFNRRNSNQLYNGGQNYNTHGIPKKKGHGHMRQMSIS